MYVAVFVNLKKKNTAESSKFVNLKSRVCSVTASVNPKTAISSCEVIRIESSPFCVVRMA